MMYLYNKEYGTKLRIRSYYIDPIPDKIQVYDISSDAVCEIDSFKAWFSVEDQGKFYDLQTSIKLDKSGTVKVYLNKQHISAVYDIVNEAGEMMQGFIEDECFIEDIRTERPIRLKTIRIKNFVESEQFEHDWYYLIKQGEKAYDRA